MAEKMLKVFISSTYRDLKEVRQLIIGDVEETLEAVAMEKFIPVNESSHRESIKHLKEIDVCIFIIGDYYGTVIKECKERKNSCKGCNGDISFTHCEYRRAVQLGKPRLVYIVENEITALLSGIYKIDLTSTEKNEVLKFLEKNNKDITKVELLSGYTLEEIRRFREIANHENREKVEGFKKEIKGIEEPRCYTPIKITNKIDYLKFHKRMKKDLKKAIFRWYKERKIHFKEFAGRRKELEELLEKLQGNSVCVVGTGGVGKTSLIQVGLLLERLSGRDVYALLKEYSYKYTRAGYSPAKEKFKWSTFSGKLTLMDVLELVFAEDVRLKSIRKMDKDGQILS